MMKGVSCTSKETAKLLKSLCRPLFNNGYVEKQPVSWKVSCKVLAKRIQESMDRCTGHRDITEILLKMALNTIHSFILKHWLFPAAESMQSYSPQ